MSDEIKPGARPGKYLTFNLADETYGVEVLKVREIIGLVPITAVPRTPSFVKGVINLRGRIVPVIDLREKFGMSRREYRRETCVVITEILAAGDPIRVGVVVDAVNEVLDVARADLEEVPSFGLKVDTSFLLGLARTKAGVKLLLDIERVLSQEELRSADAAAAAGAAPA